jgi:phage tail sheath protein FI
MARTDTERGVFKAPANVTISEVLDVQRRLTDAQQGPLNVAGVNVLRVLPGSNRVNVWGARTTVDPYVTDWLYVNVRRLLLFIEESIQDGIRWAVFEPNNQGLWKALERVIRAFLREQWRAGALFGDEEDQAFRVRIDEALNPPSSRNKGYLFIEVKVAPTRPAEFIIVRIGLFDGGAEIEEV